MLLLSHPWMTFAEMTPCGDMRVWFERGVVYDNRSIFYPLVGLDRYRPNPCFHRGHEPSSIVPILQPAVSRV